MMEPFHDLWQSKSHIHKIGSTISWHVVKSVHLGLIKKTAEKGASSSQTKRQKGDDIKRQLDEKAVKGVRASAREFGISKAKLIGCSRNPKV